MENVHVCISMPLHLQVMNNIWPAHFRVIISSPFPPFLTFTFSGLCQILFEMYENMHHATISLLIYTI